MYKLKTSDLIIFIDNLPKSVEQGEKSRYEIVVMPEHSINELLNLKEPNSTIKFKNIVFEWSYQVKEWLMIVN